MDVKEISRNGLLRKYLITVSPAETKTALNEAAQGLVNQVSLPGFRPGKVPLSIIKSRFGDSLRGDLIQKFADAGMSKAREDNEKDTIVMGAPLLNPQSFSEADGIKIELEYEIFPSIPDIDLAKIQLKKYNTDCSEEVLNKEIESLQTAQSKVKLIDKLPAASGNIVLCDWEILSMNGVSLKKGTNYVEVGDSPYFGIDEFGKYLIGGNVGETKQFEVVLQNDHFIKDHVGKQVVCTATIKNIFEQIKPSVEELYKLFGYDKAEIFMQALKEAVETRFGTWSKAMLEHELMEQIRPLLVDMELPQRALEGETQAIKARLARSAQNNTTEEQPEETDSKIQDEAKQRLRSSIFLGYIARTENIDATQTEAEDYLKTHPQTGKAQHLKDITQEEAENIRNKIITTKVIDSLLSKTEVQEIKVPYDEFYQLYQKSFY